MTGPLPLSFLSLLLLSLLLLSLISLYYYFFFTGSLPSFKAKTSNIIILSKEPDATKKEKENGKKATENLRTLLSQIMLRRTQAEILKKLLPPRTDVILYVGLTVSQELEYEEMAEYMRR